MPRRDLIRKLRKAVGRLDTRRGQREVRDVQRYASGKVGRGLRASLRRTFGAVGDFVAELADIFAAGRAPNQEDINDAVRLLESSGYSVRPQPPGEEPEPIAPPVQRARDPRPAKPAGPGKPPEPPDGPTPGATPPSRPGKAPGRPLPDVSKLLSDPETWPDEHTIDTRKLSAVLDAGAGIWAEEVLTPESSNVYSFAYDEAQGILYVSYKAAAPPGERERPNERGPTYSYGGRMRPVPRHVYVNMRSAVSKGGFVWDELRVRGTIHGHHYQYTLVSPSFAGGEIYVPRKATARGFRTRSVVAAAPTIRQVGQPRRRRPSERSTLPERIR